MTDDVSDKIDKFFSQFRLKKYSKGQILILSGDQTDYVYHLLEGKVKEYDVTYRGDEVILNIFKPPAFFPMSLAINGGTSPYIYEAETDIEFRQAPADEAVKFIKENPDVIFDLLSRVYRGIDGVLSRITYLMAGSASSRLIFELLIEAKRFGEIQLNGSYLLKINEKDLGARAGLSRETVSREFAKLKSEQIIRIDGNGITIKSLADLEHKLGQEL